MSTKVSFFLDNLFKNPKQKSKKVFIMGILNLTPDSFYDGGKYIDENNFLPRVEEMIQEGADIIDIGAASTRPGAKIISVEQEEERLLQAVKKIRKEFPDIIISIDTYHAAIAQKCINLGADMINDISGGTFDKKMTDTIAKLSVPYILMHTSNIPENMQKNTNYDNIIKDISAFFRKQIQKLNELGHQKIILDPGIGFGKTLDDNYRIIAGLDDFSKFNLPVLIGLSRKSMIQKVLDVDAKAALNGTTVMNTISLQKGANILRVHDVKEAVECKKLFEFYEKSTSV